MLGAWSGEIFRIHHLKSETRRIGLGFAVVAFAFLGGHSLACFVDFFAPVPDFVEVGLDSGAGGDVAGVAEENVKDRVTRHGVGEAPNGRACRASSRGGRGRAIR